MMHDFTAVILASASPRRKELFALLGFEFQVVPAEVEESPQHSETAPDYVIRLAEEKAQWVGARQDSSALIVAADTTVVDNGRILGKPADDADAEHMLRRLRGNLHKVYSGIAVAWDGDLHSDLCETDVPMRNYSDQEMQAYIGSGDPLDKAGAYAIQHSGFHPVENLNGCYTNVMGLPICHLARALENVGVKVSLDIPIVCQEQIDYVCPIHQLIF